MSSQQQSNTTAEQGNQSEDRIKRGLLDGTADEYVLAGELLGSEWKLPNAGNEQIRTINRIDRKQQGERVYYPEITLWPSGKTFRVNGFKERIDPTDVGDIKPVNTTATQIAERFTTDTSTE